MPHLEIRTKISPAVEVWVDDELINKPKENFVYIAFNKSMGNVFKTDASVEKYNIIDYINYQKWIFPIGQINKHNEGLIFITNILRT